MEREIGKCINPDRSQLELVLQTCGSVTKVIATDPPLN
jgi:hypothetical protein